tara:strand:+ start:100 stop:813 length:714 start_codon:yes stop_codon:yes gene_type:complete
MKTGYIYKIWSISNPEMVYYGSTQQQVCKRLNDHRKDYNMWKKANNKKLFTTSFLIFDIGEYEYATLESMEFEEKFELRNRERFYIENNKCVNICVPNRTKKEWGEENREIIKDQKKKYREANKEKLKAKAKIYHEENREKIAAYDKKYKEENREKVVAYAKKYKEENREKIKGHDKKYKEENRENLNAKSKIYREKNREKLNANAKIYREKNREKINAKAKIVRDKKRQEKMLKVT